MILPLVGADAIPEFTDLLRSGDEYGAAVGPAALRTGVGVGRASVWCRLVIIELGAGTAVPTVRRYSEVVSATCKAPLIRINVRESEVRAGNIGPRRQNFGQFRVLPETL